MLCLVQAKANCKYNTIIESYNFIFFTSIQLLYNSDVFILHYYISLLYKILFFFYLTVMAAFSPVTLNKCHICLLSASIKILAFQLDTVYEK